MEKLKDIVVIYHGKCSDGFGAAYAAWKKYGSNASYIPWQDHNTMPDGLTEKEIYVVDFSFPKELIQKLEADNKSVMVIDHHISAKDDVLSCSENIFDVERSGAVLAWKHFHPDTEIPLLLQYVEDTDLWCFNLPHHREFGAALGEYKMEFETWEQLDKNLTDRDHFSKFISHGAVIAGFEDRLVNDMLLQSEKAEFAGHEIYVLNADRTYRSILGHLLAKRNAEEGGIALGIVYYHANGRVSCSLRSEGDVDVSEMAQKYGGGGHKNAAGIDVDSFADLPFKFLK